MWRFTGNTHAKAKSGLSGDRDNRVCGNTALFSVKRELAHPGSDGVAWVLKTIRGHDTRRLQLFPSSISADSSRGLLFDAGEAYKIAMGSCAQIHKGG